MSLGFIGFLLFTGAAFWEATYGDIVSARHYSIVSMFFLTWAKMDSIRETQLKGKP